MSDNQPKDDFFTGYAKGRMAGVWGIIASDNPDAAFVGAMDSGKKDANQDAEAVGGGIAILIFLAILAPPFVAPSYVLYQSWHAMQAAYWHPVFMFLAEAAEIFIIVTSVRIFYQVVPKIVGLLLTAIYIGVCYGLAIRWLNGTPEWALGIALVSAIGGGILGFKAHESCANTMVSFASSVREIGVLYADLASNCALLVCLLALLGGGGWAVFQTYQYGQLNHWESYIIFAACAALVVILYLSIDWIAAIARGLACHAPKWLTQLIFISASTLLTGSFCLLIDLDYVWTGLALLTSAVGGWSLTKTMARQV